MLLAHLRALPAATRPALLGALATAYRDQGLGQEARDAALALCCLLLGGALARLSAGREIDPGALLAAVAQAALQGRRLTWALRDAARAERRTPPPVDADHEEAATPDHEERLDQRAALARLSARDRQVLAWQAEGLTAQEIGARLGIGIKGGERAIERARASLGRVALDS